MPAEPMIGLLGRASECVDPSRADLARGGFRSVLRTVGEWECTRWSDGGRETEEPAMASSRRGE